MKDITTVHILSLTDEESEQLVTLVQFMVRDIEDDINNELSGVSAYFLTNAYRLVRSLSKKISAAAKKAKGKRSIEGGEE